MKNILVTGGAGFIGSNFIHYMLAAKPDARIINLDALIYVDNLENLRELGWQPNQSLESGLRQTVEWYLEHPDWVAGVRAKAEYAGWLERNYIQRGGQQ